MRAVLALLTAAAIWGFAFVAQRKANAFIDPFIFNSIRFALGAVLIWIVYAVSKHAKGPADQPGTEAEAKTKADVRKLVQPVFLGVLLFLAASLQQLGMLWTGAGNAGFITGLYVLFVPLIGLLRGQKINRNIVLAALLAVAGLACINSPADISVGFGNLLVLIGALFWAMHVQMVDKLAKQYPVTWLAAMQFSVCSVLSLLAGFADIVLRNVSLMTPDISKADLNLLVGAILYAGLMSIGVAFTLQIYGQKKLRPSAASVILCLEAVFALVGGAIFLQEKLTLLSLSGAVLLLGAMLLSVLADRITPVSSQRSQ
jgi:drug/metabolite transporter (DMT)-like permease